jgi:hypothetical protein
MSEQLNDHPCSVVLVKDTHTDTSHVGFNLPNGTMLILSADSARLLGDRLIQAAGAADALNKPNPGALN